MIKNNEVERLKKFKEWSGWSYDRISKEIGAHHQTVLSWLTGKKKPGGLSRKAIREFREKQKERLFDCKKKRRAPEESRPSGPTAK